MPDETRDHRPDDALRVGVIGFGLAGATFHAPLIAATPGMRLAAVVTRDAERAERARREHPDVAVVGAAEELWERADSLDLVVVASPNATHAPLATDALRAGLPVVVDKPFARTAAEARAVVVEARRRGLAAIPFHNRRWDGDFLTVRKLLEDGALGTVYRFESRMERWRPSAKPRWTEPRAREHAEGVLHDLGSHLIDQALLLFGPARRVYAELDRRHPEHTVEDDAFVAISHESGVRSHLYASTAAAISGPRITVLGGRAGYVKHGVDVQEELLRAGLRPDGVATWGEEQEERWGTLGTAADRRAVRTERGAYQRFYEGVVATLRQGAPPPVEADEAIAGLAVIEAAQRSAEEGQAVELER